MQHLKLKSISDREIHMKNLPHTKLIFSVLLVLLLQAPISQATTAQDIWYVPSESGWGMDVVQQGSRFGFSLYVYDQNQNPTWYLGAGSSSGSFVWSGQMHAYRGSYFGGFFNSSAVGATQVGSFTFTLKNVEAATLTYTINGVSVTKSLSRFSIANQNLTGSYAVSVVQRLYNCNTGIPNQYITGTANVSISQSGTSFSMTSTVPGTGVTCFSSGTYSQAGRYGRAIGNVSCNDGSTGQFDDFEISADFAGFTMRGRGTITTQGVSCNLEYKTAGVNTSTSSF